MYRNDNESLGLVVFDNFKEFGENVHRHLQVIRQTDYDFLVPLECIKFNTGEGKGILNASVRGKDTYLLTDVMNPTIKYLLRQRDNYKSPDDHFMDLIRIIGAVNGHADMINVLMPFLYESRQHKKAVGLRESLDCAMALRHLVDLQVRNIVTVDVHARDIVNAIPFTPFYNYQPTAKLLTRLLDDYPDIEDIIVISPDNGAVGRADDFANQLMSRADSFPGLANTDRAFFYKQRDLRKVIDGKNPIKKQEYAGNDVDGKTVIIVDDMISSGASMLRVAENLNARGAKAIYMVTTFAIFDHGIKEFNDLYDKGIFNKVYATNGTYIEPDVLKSEWFQVVDISEVIAHMISDMHDRKSLEKYIRPLEFK